MKVKLIMPVAGKHAGNILWSGKYPMRGGKFPSNHPVGGDGRGVNCQFGTGQSIELFRERGYWASCFPEGDGITWMPENGQSEEQCKKDIVECFGWVMDG